MASRSTSTCASPTRSEKSRQRHELAWSEEVGEGTHTVER